MMKSHRGSTNNIAKCKSGDIQQGTVPPRGDPRLGNLKALHALPCLPCLPCPACLAGLARAVRSRAKRGSGQRVRAVCLTCLPCLSCLSCLRGDSEKQRSSEKLRDAKGGGQIGKEKLREAQSQEASELGEAKKSSEMPREAERHKEE